MRKRTPSEIKAYGDGYIEAYKEFCHLLDRHEKDKAIRKMKIFADAVALTVETATDTADTPQDERSAVMIPEREREALMRLTMCAREECGMCEYKDTCNFEFQYELATENMNILADALRVADTPQTDCGWK